MNERTSDGKLNRRYTKYYCMKYRSKIDVIGHILEVVNSADDYNNGLTKIKIRYTAFLSYAQSQRYLSSLLEKGLIEKYRKRLEEENKEKENQRFSDYYYRITDKGRHFLQIYKDLSEMMIA
jgi:predicted transcriptional regulator